MVLSPCLMSPTCLNDLAIVVVEDHDDARRYLELSLGQLGAKVVVASNAFEGHTRQVSGNDSGCPLSRLCAELLTRSAPYTPRPVTSLNTTSITTFNKTM
jgi:hypothetical protein